jgi:type II secretory pathway pseudopilin PulG
MNRIASPRPLQRLLPRLSASGFTLIELLVGSVLTVIALSAVASVAIGHIRSTDRTLWTIQLRRDLARLNTLLTAEAGESCVFRSGQAPTSCTPPSTSTTPGCTGSAGTDLQMGVQVINNGAPVTPLPVVRYFLDSGGQLRRVGPPILATGRLNTGVATVDSLLLDGVTGFTPTVATDCRSATVAVTLQVPNSTASRTRTFTLAPGVTEYMN